MKIKEENVLYFNFPCSVRTRVFARMVVDTGTRV